MRAPRARLVGHSLRLRGDHSLAPQHISALARPAGTWTIPKGDDLLRYRSLGATPHQIVNSDLTGTHWGTWTAATADFTIDRKTARIRLDWT